MVAANDNNWFELSNFPYMKSIVERNANQASKLIPSASTSIFENDKLHLLAVVMLMAQHSGGAGAVSDLICGVKELEKWIKTAPEQALEDLEEMLDQMGVSFMPEFLELEHQFRADEIKGWGVAFEGTKVMIYAE